VGEVQELEPEKAFASTHFQVRSLPHDELGAECRDLLPDLNTSGVHIRNQYWSGNPVDIHMIVGAEEIAPQRRK
jgi:hypothetical protein